MCTMERRHHRHRRLPRVALNIAALWNLPVVYVIINNGLGMGTTVAKSSAGPDLYKRGACWYR